MLTGVARQSDLKPSDDPSLIDRVSIKVADRAEGKFLYARIATSNLLRCVDEVSEQTLDELLGAHIGGVFT